MPHAIRFHKTGGPEVLSWDEVSVGKPGPGEARIRHTAVGLNFVDVYNRIGLYPSPLPSLLGAEGAGVVLEVGPGVSDLNAGDRVAYGSSPLGAYSDERVIPADLPPIRVFFEELGNVHGAFGAKGIGELPMDGPAPAIVNAVVDALGIPFDSIPLLPEDVFEALSAHVSRKSEPQSAGGAR
jgi:NADPH:quinone reductase-like Zn-dependent oxidoreductase